MGKEARGNDAKRHVRAGQAALPLRFVLGALGGSGPLALVPAHMTLFDGWDSYRGGYNKLGRRCRSRKFGCDWGGGRYRLTPRNYNSNCEDPTIAPSPYFA